ncbi:VOC family protein [Uniformispora flossi]|uniref:VOC family protein n=1 Tax=Uniformispora flossi TaxID=3390723 RepID=UPI003C2F1859
MLSTIMYVTVYVTDQDRALKFYTEGLGLEKRLDFPGPEGRFLTVGVPNSPVQILLWSNAAVAGQPGEDGVPGPLILESDDLRTDFDAMRRRGVPFEDAEPVDYPFGVRAEAVDPDGNRISLRQPKQP